MKSALIGIGAASLAAWMYLLFGRGRFWKIERPETSTEADRTRSLRIAAVIPARDEADVIGRSVASLLQQDGPHEIHVYVVDDGSTDGTAVAAQATAEEAGGQEHLTVIRGKTLPAEWSGKLWAVQQGLEAASTTTPDYFLLTDADVVHDPDNLRRLSAIAVRGKYDLTSFMVKLHCNTVAEKLLIPAFVFFFFKLYPPAWIADEKRSTAGAAGGCMLIKPEALARIEGINSIRGEIIDDCALARAIKDSGGRVWLGLTDTATSIRPYRSFSEIGRMISRTAFSQLRHSWLLLAGAVAGLGLVYLASPALVVSGTGVAEIALGAGAWALMTVAYMPMVRFYRLNPFWALSLPLAALFYMGATVHSAFTYSMGHGGQWKGRAQDVKNIQRSTSSE